ncbi:MAG: O-antigen ligase family protein [Desulfitobacteriaceae bacterium]|nr:O-antigen ligase family protein [Desulfitobacteriaceae bacterium]
MAKVKQGISTLRENGYKIVAFWGLAVLLFYPPFFRGLFFQGEQQWTLGFAAIVFAVTWLWKLSCREVSFLQKPVDFFALALVLVYLVAAFGAANARLAVAEIIKYGLYFMVFWLTSQLVQNRRDVKTLLHALYIAGEGVALAGVMCASGLIEIKDGFLGGRIYSTMQYPNALASYLTALSFVGIYLWASKKSGVLPCLYAVGNYLMLLIVIATGSRGGLLVYPVVLLVFFLGLGRSYRVPIFCHYVFILAGAFIANHKLIPMLVAKEYGTAWLWVFIGMLVALVGQGIIMMLPRLKLSKRVIGLIVGLIFVALLGGAWFQLSQTDGAKGILSEQLVRRITSINLEDANVQGRFHFWQDAMKIVKDHPVFGFGGGAFEETFRYYQSYFYSSTQVHNHYIQMWTEVGTVGILIFIGLWAFYKLTVWRLWWKGKDKENNLLVWSMFAAAISLGLHAFLDFDLSLSSIMIVLFAMFGLTRGIERYTNREYKMLDGTTFDGVKWFYYGGAIVISFGVIIYMFMLSSAFTEARTASQIYREGNFPKARVHFEKAVSRDRLNAEYLASLAGTYMKLGEKDKALETIEKAQAVAPYNPQVMGDAAGIYLSLGKINEGLISSERAVKNFPFNTYYWEGLTYRYFVVGYQAWTNGKGAEAKEMLAKAVEVPARIDTKMSTVTEQYRKMWKTGSLGLLEVSPAIKLYSGVASYILSDYSTAEAYVKEAYEKVTDEQYKIEAAMWLAVLYSKEKRGEELSQIMTEGNKLNKNFEQNVLDLSKLETL